MSAEVGDCDLGRWLQHMHSQRRNRPSLTTSAAWKSAAICLVFILNKPRLANYSTKTRFLVLHRNCRTNAVMQQCASRTTIDAIHCRPHFLLALTVSMVLNFLYTADPSLATCGRPSAAGFFEDRQAMTAAYQHAPNMLSVSPAQLGHENM